MNCNKSKPIQKLTGLILGTLGVEHLCLGGDLITKSSSSILNVTFDCDIFILLVVGDLITSSKSNVVGLVVLLKKS